MSDQISYDQVFSTDLLEVRYPNFPYPEKFCAYCRLKLSLVKTFHVSTQPYNYKCIYICYNNSCEAYDEQAAKAYVKVYYSSEQAAAMLDKVKANIVQPEKR